MKIYRFEGLLQGKKWIEPAYVTVSKNGKIKSIEGSYSGSQPIYNLQGYALPSFQNAHSHAFQYAMAGLAERHSTKDKADDFWSWREAMYALALKIEPEQLEAIATMLYSEMLRHGYTHVAEFHYLHHDTKGEPYENLAEMGQRLVNAAKKAGINITLIPIFYQKGGFGKEPLEHQRRFISSSVEDYIQLLEASELACATYKGARLGIGIHSLRGVEGEAIKEIAEYNKTKKLPFHIHISEQLKEVEECLAFYGKRPVEWLLDNVNVDENFHLVHATHLTVDEVERLAKTKANVVLCPSTEGNLGDGIFPLIEFQKNGGNWSIGTDSHVGLNPLEELRLLDYGQRLISHKRNVFFDKNEGDSALYALEKSYYSGAKAMGRKVNSFVEVGKKFNATIYKKNSPLLSVTTAQNRACTILYSSDASIQLATFSRGKLVSYKGEHRKQEQITEAFKATMQELGNR